MIIGSRRVSFKAVLYLVGVMYVSLSFLTGETIFQVPNSWFVTWMAGIFQQMDKAGFFNVWAGQSPGFNYLYFILWKPAQALGGGQYYFALTFSLIWGFISLGSLLLSAYLFYKIVRHLMGEKQGVILGTVFLLLLLTMPKWYEVIDSISIAGLLAAIYCSFKGWPKRGGVVLGITASLKPLGLVLLPVLLKSEFLSWKQRITFIASAGISAAALLLPLALGHFKIFMSSFNWQAGRPPWETLYAFFLWAAHKPYPQDPFFQDGSGVKIPDWGMTGLTPLTSLMTSAVPSYHQWYNYTFLVGLGVLILFFILFMRVQSKQEMMLGTLSLFAAYFVLFYGWSLQFVFWLTPFLLVSLPLAVSVTLRLIVLLEYPFFYALYLNRLAPDQIGVAPGLTMGMTAALAPIGEQGYWSLIIIRTLVILAIGIIAWRHLSVRFWNPFRSFTGFTMGRLKPQLKSYGGR
ncbi:MAG: hypothetical protein Q7R34_09380 [Dehalococcoidia bacterium]|nr:hypothetical protein [Dehalococcoidia bacterium]